MGSSYRFDYLPCSGLKYLLGFWVWKATSSTALWGETRGGGEYRGNGPNLGMFWTRRIWRGRFAGAGRLSERWRETRTREGDQMVVIMMFFITISNQPRWRRLGTLCRRGIIYPREVCCFRCSSIQCTTLLHLPSDLCSNIVCCCSSMEREAV